ncbi:hypothetical protein [Pseudoroseomonas cervicalis]|uniref:hypothetical protein n=1 Tax=Teichococcus cervicalis TaxID=204525 RepID=UPI002788A03C|nr:hypothetical protein [Pseudoroseomonas cervicalis]MDQ1079715.1 hypothetical protein [Pseudoroseomonas cervicalis]
MSEPEDTLFTRRGAVTAVAKECRISTAAVSQWRKTGIPTKRLPVVIRVLTEKFGARQEQAA